MTAAQGDTRTNILQAPKVTTFNGAAATIFNNQVTNYVASLIPIVGPGSVAFFPQTAQFPSGVTLIVTPVVSADRRYVRMTLSPFFNALEGFDAIQVPAAVGGSGLGGGAAAINATIQLPRFTTTTVRPRSPFPTAARCSWAASSDSTRSGTSTAFPFSPSCPGSIVSSGTSGIGRSQHEPDADGHAPDHHPRRGRGTAGRPLDGSLSGERDA